MEHQHVKMFCDMEKFTELQLCIPHTKPYGVRALGKHYHVRFDPKLGNRKCAI